MTFNAFLKRMEETTTSRKKCWEYSKEGSDGECTTLRFGVGWKEKYEEEDKNCFHSCSGMKRLLAAIKYWLEKSEMETVRLCLKGVRSLSQERAFFSLNTKQKKIQCVRWYICFYRCHIFASISAYFMLDGDLCKHTWGFEH
jgi:hypothetical protein